MPIRVDKRTFLMANDPEPRHSLKRIILPSGKAIEVVHFYDAEDAAAEESVAQAAAAAEQAASEGVLESATAEVEAPRELYRCGECPSELVYPVSWHEAGPDHWNVTLRCPDCEWSETGTFHQDLADRFDEKLEEGTDALVRDLKRLTRANMAEEIDRFVAALEAGAIEPMDF